LERRKKFQGREVIKNASCFMRKGRGVIYFIKKKLSVRQSVFKSILWNPYFLGEKIFVLKNVAPQFFKKKSETFCSKKVASRFFFSLTKVGGPTSKN